MSRKGRPVSNDLPSERVQILKSIYTDIHTCRCITTPVCRRKRRTKAQIAAVAAAEAEAASTTGSSRQTSTPRSRPPTSSPEAYISSWQTLPRVSSEASHDAGRSAYESRQEQLPIPNVDYSFSSTDTTLPIPPNPTLDFALACSASVSMIPIWSAMPAYPLTPALTAALCEGNAFNGLSL